MIFIEVCLADPRDVWKCFYTPLPPPQNNRVTPHTSLFIVDPKAEMERGGGGEVEINRMGFLHLRFPLLDNDLLSKISRIT